MEKLNLPTKRNVIIMSIIVFILGVVLIITNLKKIDGFGSQAILMLILLVPFSILYACAYFIAIQFIKIVMKKKIFVAGKSPLDFFFKKLNYILFPYLFAFVVAMLGFLGPSYYVFYKVFIKNQNQI